MMKNRQVRQLNQGLYAAGAICLCYGGWAIFESLTTPAPTSLLVYKPGQIAAGVITSKEATKPGSNESTLPKLAEFRPLWQRPWQAPIHQKPKPKPAPKRIPPLQLKYIGVIEEAGEMTAIMEDRQRQSHFLKAGDTFGATTIVSINSESVLVTHHGMEMAITLQR